MTKLYKKVLVHRFEAYSHTSTVTMDDEQIYLFLKKRSKGFKCSDGYKWDKVGVTYMRHGGEHGFMIIDVPNDDSDIDTCSSSSESH